MKIDNSSHKHRYQNRLSCLRVFSLMLLLFLTFSEIVFGFITPSQPSLSSCNVILTNLKKQKSRCFHSFIDSDGDQLNELLRVRLAGIRDKINRYEERRPPNRHLKPKEIVRALLSALIVPDEPLPDAGFRLLLESATEEWKDYIRKSIGAPLYASDELIASALGSAISRPKNQFGILVGVNDDHASLIRVKPVYSVSFPSDVVDFEDGNCWVECRLRGKLDDKLLVVMGWQMKRRKEDGAWLIDGIDWQDFRDDYRPGIGREEWMRICG